MGVWDVATPAGSDPISQGDDRIREAKTAVQESLRAQTTEGLEAVFPGSAPSTAPVYRYRGLKGTTGAKPASGQYGLYTNTTSGMLERDNGTTWDVIAKGLHVTKGTALASALGVVTLPETTDSFLVSGTETVTSITGWSAGIVTIRWASARLITHHATNLVLSQAVDRHVVAGDYQVFEVMASGQVRELAFHGACSGKSIGEVFAWAGTTAPAGSYECDGTSMVRADEPGLFAVIGTIHGAADGTHFNRPDLRGQFVRGYDHGAGVDPNAGTRTAAKTGGATGDNVGSAQADMIEKHTHTEFLNVGVSAAAGGSEIAGQTSAQSGDGSSGGTGSGNPTGDETRPKNVGLMYCIKY